MGAKATEFESGALIALATLNAVYGQPSMCANTISELGLGGTDCSELSDFDRESLSKINADLPRDKKLKGLAQRQKRGK